MLRLKGETDDAMQEQAPRGGLEEQDQITSRDAFPDEEAEWVAEDHPRWGLPGLPLRGVAVATAAFVPTFLLIFFGLPYLLAPGGPIHAALATVRAASEAPASPAPRPAPARSGTAARTAVEPPAAAVPAPERAKPEDTPPPAASAPPLPPPAPSSSRSARVEPPAPPEPRGREAVREPSPPPLPPARRSASEVRPSREARGASEPNEEQRVVEAKPAGRDPGNWTPAAAFTDRAAANRLASSIEKQGYPVEIRQDGSSSRPWVVWIGAQPSGGARRR